MPRVGALFVFYLSIAAAGDTRVAIVPRPRPESTSLPPRNIRVDVKLTQIPVSVVDGRHQPVTDLPQTAFRVFEDDVEQKIVTYSFGDAPVSLGILFDSSGSMRKRIETSSKALEQFFTTSMAQDEYFLVKFNDNAELIHRFTRQPDDILAALSYVKPYGWTALVDALCLGLQQMRHARNPRKALLVLSDGGENHSRYTEAEALSRIRESDANIYAIGLFHRSKFLEKIALETGGRVFWVHNLNDLPEIVHTLSDQIRTEYMIGYYPPNPQGDGRYHKVRVDLQLPEGTPRLHASWRQGYYAY